MDLIVKQRQLRKSLVKGKTFGYSVSELNSRSASSGDEDTICGHSLLFHLFKYHSNIFGTIREKLKDHFKAVRDFPPRFLKYITGVTGLCHLSNHIYQINKKEIAEALDSLDENILPKPLQNLYIKMIRNQIEYIVELSRQQVANMTSADLADYALGFIMSRSKEQRRTYKRSENKAVFKQIQWLGASSHKEKPNKQITVFPCLDNIGFRLNIHTPPNRAKTYTSMFNQLMADPDFQALKGLDQYCVDQFGNAVETLIEFLEGSKCFKAPMVLKFATSKNDMLRIPIKITSKIIVNDGSANLSTLPVDSKNSNVTLDDLDVLAQLENLKTMGTVNMSLTGIYSRMLFRSKTDAEKFIKGNLEFIWDTKVHHQSMQYPIRLEIERSINIKGCCDICRDHVSLYGLHYVDQIAAGHCIYNERAQMLMCL
jgi:hypothetical protein